MCTHIHNVQAERHKCCWLFAPQEWHDDQLSLWIVFMLATVDDVNISFKAPVASALPVSCTPQQEHHTNAVHIGWDQFSLATSVLCSNVLIMIGFVCNYKHSETPISKSLIKFRPMGILGCFWKMHTLTYILTNTHTAILNFKNTLLSEMSEQLLHAPWRPLPSSPRSALVACVCRV